MFVGLFGLVWVFVLLNDVYYLFHCLTLRNHVPCLFHCYTILNNIYCLVYSYYLLNSIHCLFQSSFNNTHCFNYFTGILNKIYYWFHYFARTQTCHVKWPPHLFSQELELFSVSPEMVNNVQLWNIRAMLQKWSTAKLAHKNIMLSPMQQCSRNFQKILQDDFTWNLALWMANPIYTKCLFMNCCVSILFLSYQTFIY